ncbi:MAG: tetratricopeptide repeat protein [Chlorobiota bacterium]
MSVAWPDEQELESQLRQLTLPQAVDYLNELAERASQQAPQKVRDFARRAYELALRGAYREGLAEACRLLGVGALFAGQYGEAHTWFEQAATIFAEVGQWERYLHTLVNWALAYHAVGDSAAGLEKLQQALDEGADDYPVVSLKLRQNLGVILAELGHYERALQTFEEVIAQAQRQGVVRVLVRAYNNAALLLAQQGRYEQALEMLHRSMQLKEQAGDKYGMAVAYGTLGFLYAQMGRLEDAEQAYQRSLSLRCQLQDRRGSGYVLTNLAQLYRRKGMYAAAEEALAEAERIAEELQERALQLEVFQELSLIAQHQANFMQGLYYLQRYVSLSQQLRAEAIQQSLAKVEARYEAERYRREREQLRRWLVEWQYRALQAQMNPHFLFNVFTALQHLVSTGDLEAAQRLISQFAKLSRQVLRTSQRGLVSLEEELETLELYLRVEQLRFRGSFRYSIEVQPGVELGDVWCPSLLLQPLAENALKHGLGPRGGVGTVRIEVQREGDSVVCAIEDDGVGRQSPAPALPTHGSAGLRLAEERLRLLSQHFGQPFALRIVDLRCPDGSPAGTRVEVVLPAELDVLRLAEVGLTTIPAAGKPIISP